VVVSQHCMNWFGSHDAYVFPGQLPASSYETSPLDSHVGQTEPQHASGRFGARQVPFGHVMLEPAGS
jgi:hypothetical protein